MPWKALVVGGDHNGQSSVCVVFGPLIVSFRLAAQLHPVRPSLDALAKAL